MLDKRGYMIPKAMREMTPDDFMEKFGEYPSREALTLLVVSVWNVYARLTIYVWNEYVRACMSFFITNPPLYFAFV
jgi:hypothetical protein